MWKGALLDVWAGTVKFELENDWVVTIDPYKGTLDAELMTEGRSLTAYVNTKQNDGAIKRILDILAGPQDSINLAMLLLLPRTSYKATNTEEWVTAIAYIDFDNTGRPLEPEYEFPVRTPYLGYIDKQFDTARFLKSVYFSSIRRELTKSDRDSILYAMSILQKKNALWHPEIRKWATKISAKLMSKEIGP